jgi:hypothetical protein
MENLLHDVELAEKLCKEDRLSESFQLLTDIEMYIKTEKEDIRKKVAQRIASSSHFESVRSFGFELQTLLQLIESMDSWNVWNGGIGSRCDIRVSTHKNEERGHYFCKIEGKIRKNFVKVLAACLESSFFKHWLPFCNDFECVSVINASRMKFQAEFDFALLKRSSFIQT